MPTTIRDNGAVFENMLARIDGRVYYNLVNWYRALALLPGFSLNRAHMETMMGVSEPLPAAISATIGPPPATGLRKLREYLRLGRMGLGLAVHGAAAAPNGQGVLPPARCCPEDHAGGNRRSAAVGAGRANTAASRPICSSAGTRRWSTTSSA